MTVALALAGAALFIAGAAAVFDHRRREIPDWLTLPPIGLVPIGLGLSLGAGAAVRSLLGAAACAVVPLLLARRGAMGGGDVKLFAALGALLGFTLGLEAQLLAFFFVLGHAGVGRARRGELEALWRGTCEALRRSLSRGEAGRVNPETMEARPLAPYIAAGVALALGLELVL